MDDSLKKLEAQLEALVPCAQSDGGRDRCHDLLDQLVKDGVVGATNSPIGFSWISGAVAASVALGLGFGGGWYLGQDSDSPAQTHLGQVNEAFAADFEQLDQETWLVSAETPSSYVSISGEVRELLRETEVTQNVVKHRESGTIVTVETTDHHLIDSEKSDF